MTRIKLRYVNEYIDRHGKIRRYFRRPGRKGLLLPGLPGSIEFMTAYQAALAMHAPPPHRLSMSLLVRLRQLAPDISAPRDSRISLLRRRSSIEKPSSLCSKFTATGLSARCRRLPLVTSLKRSVPRGQV